MEYDKPPEKDFKPHSRLSPMLKSKNQSPLWGGGLIREFAVYLLNTLKQIIDFEIACMYSTSFVTYNLLHILFFITIFPS